MGAGAMAAAALVRAALPGPQPAIGLAQHSRALEDGQVGGHRLQHLGRQGAVIEGIPEAGAALPQLFVIIAPEVIDRRDVTEAGEIPGLVMAGAVIVGAGGRFPGFLPEAQVGAGDMPGQPQGDGPGRARLQGEGQVKAPARAGDLVGGIRRGGGSGSRLDVFPGQGQRVPPAAAEPAAVDCHRRVIHRGQERSALPGVLGRALTAQDEAARGLQHPQ